MSPSRSAFGNPNPIDRSSVENAAKTICPTLSFQRPPIIRS
jgi:hypothetical protein